MACWSAAGRWWSFSKTWLLDRGAPELARAAGLSEAEARRRLLRHLRVCLDTCHLAVAYEDPAAALAALAQNGIQVGKVQITAGLKVTVPANGRRAALARQLEPFTRSPYLHQVIAREDGGRVAALPGPVAGPGLAGPLPPGPVAHPLPHAPVCGALRGPGHHRGGDPGGVAAAQGTAVLSRTWRSRPTPGSGCPRT